MAWKPPVVAMARYWIPAKAHLQIRSGLRAAAHPSFRPLPSARTGTSPQGGHFIRPG